MIFSGTIINAIGIVAGGAIGVLLSGLLEKHERLKKIPDAMMRAVGLCVMYIGISGMLSGMSGAGDAFGDFGFLIAIGCIALGTLIGELIGIDDLLDKLGKAVEKRLSKKSDAGSAGEGRSDKRISTGFVNATLLFCVGAMAITGAIESGLSQGEAQSTLLAKSMIDMISSVIFGASFGIGTIFSAVSVLIYQGLIELLAILVGDFLPSAVIALMNGCGSALILAIGLNMVGATKFKVANMLPAIFLPLICCIFI